MQSHKQGHTCKHSRTHTSNIDRLTDTPQALLVKAPYEVSTQVTPRGLSVAAGLEVVPFALLLWELGVLGAAQDPDDAHPAQEVRNLSGADPQGVRPLQARRRARRPAVRQFYRLSAQPQVTQLDELAPRHRAPQSQASSIVTDKQKDKKNLIIFKSSSFC